MKKKLFKITLILIGFIIGFLLTFPLKTIVLSILSKNDVQFSEVKGNIHEMELKNVEKDGFFIPRLKFKNYVFVQKIYIDGADITVYPSKKIANIKFKNFQLKNFVKDKDIDVDIKKGELNVYLDGSDVLLEGNADLEVKRIQGFQLGNAKIEVKLKPNRDEKVSEVEANIEGKEIKGTFTGNLKLNLKNEKEQYIEGVFRGQFLEGPIEMEIKQQLEGLK
jgi:hypothetical protein